MISRAPPPLVLSSSAYVSPALEMYHPGAVSSSSRLM